MSGSIAPETAAGEPTRVLAAALRRMRLVGAAERPRFTPLAGGISSDIYRVDTAAGPICVKRALPRLRVAAIWRVPTERSRYEARWLAAANRVLPGVAPRLLATDEPAGALAMAWLDPKTHPVWKRELAGGRVDPEYARAVGHRLARLHRAHAGDPATATDFASDELFHLLRLEPYLLATADRHPDLAGILTRLADDTAARRETLVHGDVSPKNLLVGPAGPVIIDAECAWYGDPAFDLAFCLNHLFLKSAWRPQDTRAHLAAIAALIAGYGPDRELDARTARLLPGLLLARLDGKSPVEYLDDERARAGPRRFARRWLASAPAGLRDLTDSWAAGEGR